MLAIAGQMARPNGLVLFQRKINFFLQNQNFVLSKSNFFKSIFFLSKVDSGGNTGYLSW